MEHKLVYRHASAAVGGSSRVLTVWDASEELSVDLLVSIDSPRPGFTAISTLTLCAEMTEKFPAVSAGFELIGSCRSDCDGLEDALTTTAFLLIEQGLVPQTRTVFEAPLQDWDAPESMRRLYLTEPTAWPALGNPVAVAAGSVGWLWTIPVTAAEAALIDKQGGEAFEELLKRVEVDPLDPFRPSIA